VKRQLQLFYLSLKNHPGLFWAFFLPFLIWVAAIQGAAKTEDGEMGLVVVIAATIFSILPLIIVLTTAWQM